MNESWGTWNMTNIHWSLRSTEEVCGATQITTQNKKKCHIFIMFSTSFQIVWDLTGVHCVLLLCKVLKAPDWRIGSTNCLSRIGTFISTFSNTVKIVCYCSSCNIPAHPPKWNIAVLFREMMCNPRLDSLYSEEPQKTYNNLSHTINLDIRP